MSEITGTCSLCGNRLTTTGCLRCNTTTITTYGTQAPAGHFCCYHPTSGYYTTNPPRQIEACCHCGQQRGMAPTHLSPPPVPPGHGPYYPRNF